MRWSTLNHEKDDQVSDDDSWKAKGLCRRFPDINFVPDPFLGEDSQPAKRVCEHCPVIAECRMYREQHRHVGVWGGEDEVDFVLRVSVGERTICPCGDGETTSTLLGVVCSSCGRVTA